MIDAVVEQYVGNTLVNTQKAQIPTSLLQMQFTQWVQQIASQKQPMRIKVIVPTQVWDKFNQQTKTLETSIEFQNWKDD